MEKEESNIDNLILNRNIIYSINPFPNEEIEKEKENFKEKDLIINKENKNIIKLQEKLYEKDIISKGNYI